jgi:hypothetical protein
MAKSPVADEHHVVRWIPKTKWTRKAGKNIVFPDAFELRPATSTRPAEKYLSAAWAEYYAGSKDEQVRATAKAIAAHLKGVNSAGAFAIGNVGEIKSNALMQNNANVFIYSGVPGKWPAYSEVWGIERDATDLHQLLSAQAWAETMPASDVLLEMKESDVPDVV